MWTRPWLPLTTNPRRPSHHRRGPPAPAGPQVPDSRSGTPACLVRHLLRACSVGGPPQSRAVAQPARVGPTPPLDTGGHVTCGFDGGWGGQRAEGTQWALASGPGRCWQVLFLTGPQSQCDSPGPAMVPSLPPEPDNEAHMRSASRPCSPVHHHEGHAKLAGSPPRASPVRMGPSYVLKKGWQDRAGRAGQWVGGASARAGGAGSASRATAAFAAAAPPSPPLAPLGCERGRPV